MSEELLEFPPKVTRELCETSSSGFDWKPLTIRYPQGFLSACINRATPKNEQLIRLTNDHAPPQTWFDSTDDPF